MLFVIAAPLYYDLQQYTGYIWQGVSCKRKVKAVTEALAALPPRVIHALEGSAAAAAATAATADSDTACSASVHSTVVVQQGAEPVELWRALAGGVSLKCKGDLPPADVARDVAVAQQQRQARPVRLFSVEVRLMLAQYCTVTCIVRQLPLALLPSCRLKLLHSHCIPFAADTPQIES
jgi:hypothetical protein